MKKEPIVQLNETRHHLYVSLYSDKDGRYINYEVTVIVPNSTEWWLEIQDEEGNGVTDSDIWSTIESEIADYGLGLPDFIADEGPDYDSAGFSKEDR